ncbi:heavy-metal-associated domain-containing protein [Nocardiopsis metallicus]|uniref:Copper chaperone CopZ n=1 Tax=Nocardiopsis metallicus TaxID=179819 RepID=A0A840WNI1_9ACTN|nr:heavy-metal-associated domain-containing protein [Nocardiopsis metallicus]MBB5494561.1 copper chaperone CopZ [Nocardiopsis metallicus]
MSATQTYAVTGMTCGHCEGAVRTEVSRVSGVAKVEVSSAMGRLIVTAGEQIDDAAVIAAVEEAGYAATRN